MEKYNLLYFHHMVVEVFQQEFLQHIGQPGGIQHNMLFHFHLNH